MSYLKLTITLHGNLCCSQFFFSKTECGDGWIARGASEPNDTSCYQFNRNLSDWYSARKRCQQIGGDLAVITSLSEQTFIKSKTCWLLPVSQALAEIHKEMTVAPLAMYKFSCCFIFGFVLFWGGGGDLVKYLVDGPLEG